MIIIVVRTVLLLTSQGQEPRVNLMAKNDVNEEP